MAFFQGRPKARGSVVTQSNFIYTHAYRFVCGGEYNIVVIFLICYEYVTIFSVAYLLHVASCY